MASGVEAADKLKSVCLSDLQVGGERCYDDRVTVKVGASWKFLKDASEHGIRFCDCNAMRNPSNLVWVANELTDQQTARTNNGCSIETMEREIHRSVLEEPLSDVRECQK